MNLKKNEKFEKIKSALITKFLAEKLKKEEELVRLNNHILNVKYLELKRKEKNQELLTNFSEIKHVAEKFLDFKSRVYLIFQENFKNDQDINLFVFTNFIFIKDELISNFVQNIGLLRQDFVKRVEEIKLQFEVDKANIENSYSNHIKVINEQIMAMEADFYYEMVEDEKNFSHKKEFLKCEHVDQIVTLRVIMEKKINNLQKIFDDTKKSIESEMLYFSKSDEISSKNEKIEFEIQKDRQKIISLLDKCQSLREEINLIDIDFLLFNKKKAIHEQYINLSQLNQKFEIKKKKIKEKILNIIKSSALVIKKLHVQTEKCRKILVFFSMCQKMETLEENNTLFCKSNMINEEIDWNKMLANKEQIDDLFMKNLLDQEFNENNFKFYSKFAKVKIEIESLKLAKLDLKKENLALKNLLKNYISNIEINCCF